MRILMMMRIKIIIISNVANVYLYNWELWILQECQWDDHRGHQGVKDLPKVFCKPEPEAATFM